MRESIYWLEGVERPTFPSRPPEKCRTLIIGGGYTGLAAAIGLRRAGEEATVIDAKPLATGASSRNGGMVLTGLSEDPEKVIQRNGLETARRLYAESEEAVDLIERLVRDGGIDCDFRRTGYIVAAYKPGHWEGLKGLRDLLERDFNRKTELLTAAELAGELGSAAYHGGLLKPRGAGFNPAKFASGLLKMARDLGVDLYENVAARQVDRRGTGYVVRTDQGAVRAERVVIAANGYLDRLVPYLGRRIVPVRSLMIATEPLPPEEARSLIPRDRMFSDTKIFLYYFRLSPDGRRLLFGGRPRHYRRGLLDNARVMQRDMLSIFPRLKPYRVDCAWWGKLGFTLDRLPHIGGRDNLFFALGYCGHGAALAVYLGDKLAGMVQGRPCESEFSRPRFRAVPFHHGRPWFLPLVYNYFSLKDWAV
ncbi:MAG: FAD-binding oxidoreductase [Pseudomonadota bacterium]